MLELMADGNLLAGYIADGATRTREQIRSCAFRRRFFHADRKWAKAAILACALLLPLCTCGLLAQRPSVMIWPIKPILEGNQTSTAIWVENRGSHPVTLQARIVSWDQKGKQDNYNSNQRMVALSPPLATVEPGNRQLLRIVRLQDSPSNQESAFRILLDELPEATESKPTHTSTDVPAAAMGIRFRMRYSLPLFLRGSGFNNPQDRKFRALSLGNELVWKTVQIDGERWLEVHNPGRTHARLTAARFLHREKEYALADGLLGYVLPGSSMRWRVPATVPAEAALQLQAKVNGKETVLSTSR